MEYFNSSQIGSLLLAAIISFSTSSQTIAQRTDSKSSSPKSLQLGPNTNIEFVSVGDAGNAPDTNGLGSVGQPFEIGKFDITAEQYCLFLNAVAKDDPNGLYDLHMHSDSTVASLIRHGDPGSYTYNVLPGAEKFPITYVTLLSAVRFCNWLENGQPTGPQGPETTENGAYTIAPNAVFSLEIRGNDDPKSILEYPSIVANPKATYQLPTFNEWYKAVYYKGGSLDAGYWKFPTQTDDFPGNSIGDQPHQMNYYNNWSYGNGTSYLGSFFSKDPHITTVGSFTASPGPYGTFDMCGNVKQWTIDSNVFKVTTKKSLLARTIAQGSHFTPPLEYYSITESCTAGVDWSEAIKNDGDLLGEWRFITHDKNSPYEIEARGGDLLVKEADNTVGFRIVRKTQQ